MSILYKIMGEKKRKENAKPVFVFGKKKLQVYVYWFSMYCSRFYLNVWWR